MEQNLSIKPKEEKYQLIDILKFICAIFVVGIHSEIVKDPNNDFQWYVLHIIFRIAVPFFFLCSGFLFGKKYKENKEKLKEICKKQIKRLFIPFIFWMLISLPYIVLTTKGNSIISITKEIIKKIIFYPWGALWFVLAVIVAIGILYFFLRKDKLNLALILSGFLFIIALLGNSYYFVLEGTFFKDLMDIYIKICISVRNGVFVGFPIFTAGVYIAQKENVIENIKKYKLYLCFAILILIQIFEVTFIRDNNYIDDHSLFFTTIFIVAILLMLCIKYKNIYFNKVNTKLLRNLSTSIYFMHAPIIRYTSLGKFEINDWTVFLGTIIITISISLILYKVNNKYINHIIK